MDIESKVWSLTNTGTKLHAFKDGMALCSKAVRERQGPGEGFDYCEAEQGPFKLCTRCDVKFNAAIEPTGPTPASVNILDAYCCQGGAGAGYSAAGAEVRGVDLVEQPRYPYRFCKGDAVAYIREHGKAFDFIHASPPCRHYSATQRIQGNDHPDLIGPTRDALNATGRPWVIENVGDALPWMRNPVMLCGAMFGLHTYRHRWFETGGGFTFTPPEHPEHVHPTVKMGRPVQEGDWYHAVGNFSGVRYIRKDMGVPWMNRDGIRECIPPAYTRYIGTEFLRRNT